MDSHPLPSYSLPSYSLPPDAQAPRLQAGPRPMLKGQVCVQYVRCGKPGCRCVDGEPHGPYHYRVWRDGDKVRKAYVRRAELAEVQAACHAYQEYLEHLRRLRLQRLALVKDVSRAWRKAQPYLRATPS